MAGPGGWVVPLSNTTGLGATVQGTAGRRAGKYRHTSAPSSTPPPRSVQTVGVSESGAIRYAQTGFSTGSSSVMNPASCGLMTFNPRVNSQYGSAIWNDPNRAMNTSCRPVGAVSHSTTGGPVG